MGLTFYRCNQCGALSAFPQGHEPPDGLVLCSNLMCDGMCHELQLFYDGNLVRIRMVP